jgi:hypothetical protein
MSKFYMLSIFTALSFSALSQTPTVDWAHNTGFNGVDVGKDVITDPNGNVYTVGHFEASIDADPGSNVALLTSNGAADILITKLDATGNFVWAKNIGSSTNDAAFGVTFYNNHLYVTGYFTGTADFDPSGTVANLTSVSGTDVFLLKLDNNGNYMFAKSLGGNGDEIGYGLDFDGTENIYITGSFTSLNADFDPSGSTAILTSNGGSDAFLASYTNTGSFISAQSFGSTSDDVATAIDIDYNGFVNLTGYFSGTVDFNPAPLNTNNGTSNGGTDIFVLRFYSGAYYSMATFGGTSDDKGLGITGDTDNNVTYTGYFQSAVDFNNIVGQDMTLTSAGLADVIIGKVNNYCAYMWAKQIGNVTDDKAFGITVDASNNLLLTGTFKNTIDIDPSGAGINNITSTAGGFDIFLLKLNTNGGYVWANFFQQTSGVLNNNQGNAVHVDANDDLYVTGYMQGYLDYDFNAMQFGPTLNPYGLADVFTAKIAFSTSVFLTCPADQNLLLSTSPPIVPNLAALATATTNCPAGGIVITQSPAAGTALAFGATIVTISVLNDCGDVSSCQVTVNYTNDLSIAVQCPVDQIVSSNICPDYVAMSTVSSVCPGAGVVTTQTPAAGSILSLGSNLITINTSNSCSLSAQCSFNASYVLGLQEETISTVSLYPNPAKTILTIVSVKPTTLGLINVQGQLLQTIEVATETTIELSTFASGMYYLVDEKNNHLKFIKE